MERLNKKFNHWTVLYIGSPDKKGKRKCISRCDCGRLKLSKDFSTIKTGRSKQCKACAFRQTLPGSTHKMSKTRIYKTWSCMKNRCNKKSDLLYGGRGIKVCEEWNNDFMSFYNWAMSHGYKDDLTIDRIDTNGDYCPSNCRWVDSHTQAANRRIRENSSGFHGVFVDNKLNEFTSEIRVRGKRIYLGRFKSALEAAKTRDEYIIKNNLLEYPLSLGGIR